MTTFSPILWENHTLKLLDQRKLPHEEVFIEIKDLKDCHTAIHEMVVRGAPCIGFSAILGLATWMRQQKEITLQVFREACDYLISSRPTAVNLAFEVNRCFDLISSLSSSTQNPQVFYQHLVDFGIQQINESEEKNRLMSKFAINELKKIYPGKKLNLMTHCNTGFLACGSHGTALGVISQAFHEGLVSHVYADETRPYMQGSRLTAFELKKENIPFDLVVEGAASYLMSRGLVDAIFVGADRIVRNGDTANKVGTSTLAIVAHHYRIPFYVVAPISSFDLSMESGHEIDIELRTPDEILMFNNKKVAPSGATALNPSFDVTDHRLISGIVCEKGMIFPHIPNHLMEVLK